MERERLDDQEAFTHLRRAYHRVARELLALASDSLSDAVASVLASKVAPAQAG